MEATWRSGRGSGNTVNGLGDTNRCVVSVGEFFPAVVSFANSREAVLACLASTVICSNKVTPPKVS